jgi:hypothetical protein
MIAGTRKDRTPPQGRETHDHFSVWDIARWRAVRETITNRNAELIPTVAMIDTLSASWPGFVPAIHVFGMAHKSKQKQDVDARDISAFTRVHSP